METSVRIYTHNERSQETSNRAADIKRLTMSFRKAKKYALKPETDNKVKLFTFSVVLQARATLSSKVKADEHQLEINNTKHGVPQKEVGEVSVTAGMILPVVLTDSPQRT